MRQFLSLLLAASMLMGHPGIGTPGETPTEPVPTEEVTAEPVREPETAYADFAIDLLRASQAEGKNTLMSPLSVTLALGMTANGAAGETREEFTDLFGMAPEELNVYCRELMDQYSKLGGSSQTNLANSLWCDPSLTLNDSFVQTCRGSFDAELFHADLQSGQTMRDVNSWVGKATRGKIPEVLKKPFSDDAVLALINAVYFKNQFARPFETPGSPWTMDFHNADGTLAQPKGMRNGTRREIYLSHDGGQGVLLPYDDETLGLLLMLPDEDVSLTEYLKGWDGQTIAALLEGQRDAQVSLTMPKFQARWRDELREPLKALGLTRAFGFGAADFSSMGSSPIGPLYLTSVIHEAVFEINEKGTEAAAVTVVVGGAGSARPPEETIYLTLDRPFLYGIVDLENGTPLFLGTLEQM